VPPSPRFSEVAARVRNWGRWGDEDQLGTLNLIDAAERRQAARSVRSGLAIGLSLPLSEEEGVQMGFVPGRNNPRRSMTSVNEPLSPDPEWICSSEDTVEMALQCATHWDGLAHVSYHGHIYNGFPADTVTADGASACGIHLVETLVGRGILLDVARAKGVEVLEPGYPITPDDLDAAAELGRLDVLPGDIVLVRTGQMVHLEPGRRDLVSYTWPSPGLTIGTAEWLHAKDVAAVATDTLPLEVFPGEEEDLYLPVHLLHLVEMGMTQGQNWVLDTLADACADDGSYAFFLDATPLTFTGGLGSPVAPVAVK